MSARSAAQSFERAYQNAPVALGVLDGAGRLLCVNDKLAELSGRPPDWHAGRPLAGVLPSIAAVVDQALPQLLATDASGSALDLCGLNGDERPPAGAWRVRLQALLDEPAGDAVGIALLEMSDVAPTAMELGSVAERHRRLLESARVIPWETDVTGWRFTYVGRQVEAILGYPREHWYAPDFWVSHVHPDDRPSAVERCQRFLEHERHCELEYRMVAADGGTVWLQDLISVERVPGRPRLIGGYMIDITERKLAEERVRQQDEQLRLLADALPALIGYLDREHRFRFINAAGRRWFGLSREQARGRHAADALGVAWQSFRGRLEAALGGRDVTFEIELPMPNGASRPVEATLVPQQLARNGRVEGVYVLAMDVGERRQADRALRRAFDEIAELKDRLEAENVLLREEIRRSHGFEEIVGESVAVKRVLHRVEQIAASPSTVLILGETGTGKELIAQAIHRHSPRRDRPMVKVSCAALPSSLIESELFGHEKGAFTGALSRKIGRFELADGGTLFLDEIGDLAPELQIKLLRVLQEGEFERVGSSRTLRVDVRVIAATNRDLPAAIEDGSFRTDLYYRINVLPIELPPLRARRDDIPLLVWHFVNRLGTRLGRSIDRIPQPTMERLARYDWPGNVRELENAVERAVVLSKGRTLTLDSAAAELAPVPGPLRSAARSDRIADVERAHILRVLESSRWKIKGCGNAAERLGLNPSTLRFRMRRLGISRP